MRCNCGTGNSCCSPIDILAQELAETTNRAIQAYNMAVDAVKNPVTEDLIINADLIVNGDIIQQGAAYETHAEKVYTNDDYIIMRDGALAGLAPGDYSGFQVTKYDGTNDGRLVIDGDGTARVGDVNDEQPLATRDESGDMTNGELVMWNGGDLKLVTSGKSATDMFEEASDTLTTGVFMSTPGTAQEQTLTMPNSVKFEQGYDYFIFFNASDSASVRMYENSVSTNAGSFKVVINAMNDFYLTFKAYRVKTASPLTGRARIFGSVASTDGGGGGGLDWTLRTANNDWTDIFSWDGAKLTVLKNIVLKAHNYGLYFIPKGSSYTGGLKLHSSTVSAIANSLYTDFVIDISDRITSNRTTLYVTGNGAQFTTDGSSISITSASTSTTLNKSYCDIYTAD